MTERKDMNEEDEKRGKGKEREHIRAGEGDR